MNDRKINRIRRARRGRERMKRRAQWRLSVFRSGRHLYAQVMSVTGGRIVAAASTAEAEIRKAGSRMDMAYQIGQAVAERTRKQNLEQVAFDRSGYKYHGHIKALAEGARAGGLKL